MIKYIIGTAAEIAAVLLFCSKNSSKAEYAAADRLAGSWDSINQLKNDLIDRIAGQAKSETAAISTFWRKMKNSCSVESRRKERLQLFAKKHRIVVVRVHGDESDYNFLQKNVG